MDITGINPASILGPNSGIAPKSGMNLNSILNPNGAPGANGGINTNGININGINANERINQNGGISPLSSGNRFTISAPGESGDFGSVIKDAVESIDNTQKSAEQEVAKAVSGESPDLHKTIIALQTADLKFQLGLQVRNKMIGAYEEIMRMQV